MSIVGCIQSTNCLSGICLVGKVSFWDVLGRTNVRRDFSGRGSIHQECVWLGKCPSAMCLDEKVSIGDVFCRGSVRCGLYGRGCVWLGKHLSGMCMIGEVPIRKESVREMSFGDVSGNPEYRYVCKSDQEVAHNKKIPPGLLTAPSPKAKSQL